MSVPFQNLPDWSRWLAQDADGAWWAYEAEPHSHDTGWYENEVGRSARVGKGYPNADWHQTLTRVT